MDAKDAKEINVAADLADERRCKMKEQFKQNWGTLQEWLGLRGQQWVVLREDVYHPNHSLAR